MNESVRKTKYLTEAAAAAAIASLLVLLKLLAPFLVFVTMIASPIPIAVICDFHGMKWGFGTSAGVIILVTMIGGPEIGLTTAFYAGLSAWPWAMDFFINCPMGKRSALRFSHIYLKCLIKSYFPFMFSALPMPLPVRLTASPHSSAGYGHPCHRFSALILIRVKRCLPHQAWLCLE